MQYIKHAANIDKKLLVFYLDCLELLNLHWQMELSIIFTLSTYRYTLRDNRLCSVDVHNCFGTQYRGCMGKSCVQVWECMVGKHDAVINYLPPAVFWHIAWGIIMELWPVQGHKLPALYRCWEVLCGNVFAEVISQKSALLVCEALLPLMMRWRARDFSLSLWCLPPCSPHWLEEWTQLSPSSCD